MAKDIKTDTPNRIGAKFTFPNTFFNGLNIERVLEFLNDGAAFAVELKVDTSVKQADDERVPEREVKNEAENLGVFDLDEEYVPASKRRKQIQEEDDEGVRVFDTGDGTPIAPHYNPIFENRAKGEIPIIDVPVNIRPVFNFEGFKGDKSNLLNALSQEDIQRMLEQNMYPFMGGTPNITINPQNITINPQTVTMNPTSVMMNPQTVTMNPQSVMMNPDAVYMNPQTVTMNPETVLMQPQSVNITPEVVNITPDVVNIMPDVVNIMPDVVNITPEIVNITPEVVNIRPDSVNLNAEEVRLETESINITPNTITVDTSESVVVETITHPFDETPAVVTFNPTPEVTEEAQDVEAVAVEGKALHKSGTDPRSMEIRTRVVGVMNPKGVVFYDKNAANAAKDAGIKYGTGKLIDEETEKALKDADSGITQAQIDTVNRIGSSQATTNIFIIPPSREDPLEESRIRDIRSEYGTGEPEIVELDAVAPTTMPKPTAVPRQTGIAAFFDKLISLFRKKKPQKPFVSLPAPTAAVPEAKPVVEDGLKDFSELDSVYDYFGA